jgi:adenylate cyclase
MGNNEEATIRTLANYLETMGNLIQKHRGRVVDATGDNLLAEFTSAVDAVNCAVGIQRELAERNEKLPEERRMLFRIGINLGDVVEEEGRIFGDGVNIAARIEGLAEAGGICLSGTVYDSIENKLGLEYEYMGEQKVKNIQKPIRIYRVLMHLKAPVLIDTDEKIAFPLPDKPSLAVLPFENMSGDPKQDYFSDGLTDQIISTLSKLRNLFVISRSSTFTYKGKPVKVQEVAEDLGVKYVLEGSVQRTADRIRIIAQLIDATTGHHIWSERYDREQKDIFAIQDDITMEITKELRVEFDMGEQIRFSETSTTNLRAWEKYLQGRNYSWPSTKEDNAIARRLFKEAIVIDPMFANSYVNLGFTHFWDARFGWVESRAESINMALKYAQKAIELNDTVDHAYTLIGGVYLLQGQHEKAITEGERAIALNPNGAINYSALAGFVGCSGKWEESIEYAKKAIRLQPFAPAMYYHWLGRAYFMIGQYHESIATWKKALNESPDYLPAHAFLAACYISLDRDVEASAAAKEVLRINPKFSLESYAKTLPYKNKADIERYMAALRKAGLK